MTGWNWKSKRKNEPDTGLRHFLEETRVGRGECLLSDSSLVTHEKIHSNVPKKEKRHPVGQKSVECSSAFCPLGPPLQKHLRVKGKGERHPADQSRDDSLHFDDLPGSTHLVNFIEDALGGAEKERKKGTPDGVRVEMVEVFAGGINDIISTKPTRCRRKIPKQEIQLNSI